MLLIKATAVGTAYSAFIFSRPSYAKREGGGGGKLDSRKCGRMILALQRSEEQHDKSANLPHSFIGGPMLSPCPHVPISAQGKAREKERLAS